MSGPRVKPIGDEVRRWLVAAAAAALVASGCSGSIATSPAPTLRPTEPASPPQSATPVAASPADLPTAAPAGPVAAWQVTLEIEEAQVLDLVAAGDSVLLAGEDGQGFVRTSDAGGAWGPAERPSGSGPGSAVTGLAVGPGGPVALGATLWQELPQGAAWRYDGEGWASATVSSPLPYYWMSDAAWDGSSFIGVGDAGCTHPVLAQVVGGRLARATIPGVAASPSCPDAPWSRPVLWASADGARWNAEPELPHEEGGISSVAVGPAGVVAVGGRSGQPAAWVRGDRGWQVHPLPESGWLGSVEPIGDAFLMLGREADGTVAWHSPDGVSWDRRPLELPLRRLAPIPGGLVGLGGEYDEEENLVGSPVIAVTQDGVAWTRLPDDPALDGIDLVDLAVAGDRVVVAGSNGVVLEADAAILGLPGEP